MKQLLSESTGRARLTVAGPEAIKFCVALQQNRLCGEEEINFINMYWQDIGKKLRSVARDHCMTVMHDIVQSRAINLGLEATVTR